MLDNVFMGVHDKAVLLQMNTGDRMYFTFYHHLTATIPITREILLFLETQNKQLMLNYTL